MPKKQSQINFTMGQVKAPCKDCPERFTGCHAVCDKYEDYKQTLEAEKERYRAFKESDCLYNEYVSESIKRNKKVQK
jgi:hypothetical protein